MKGCTNYKQATTPTFPSSLPFCPPPLYTHSRHAPGEEVDTDDSLEDVGEEWPDFEEPSIARQREFHQVSHTHSYITFCCHLCTHHFILSSITALILILWTHPQINTMLTIISRYSLLPMPTSISFYPHVVLVWSGTRRLSCWPANSHSGNL